MDSTLEARNPETCLVSSGGTGQMVAIDEATRVVDQTTPFDHSRYSLDFCRGVNNQVQEDNGPHARKPPDAIDTSWCLVLCLVD